VPSSSWACCLADDDDAVEEGASLATAAESTELFPFFFEEAASARVFSEGGGIDAIAPSRKILIQLPYASRMRKERLGEFLTASTMMADGGSRPITIGLPRP